MIAYYLTTWWQTFLAAMIQLWNGIAAAAIPFIGAALILLIGWFLAFFFGRLIKKILGQDNINWDKALSGIKLAKLLEDRLGLSTDVGAFLGWFVKWFLIIASFMAAVNVLQFQTVNSFLGELVGFLPMAITAALIVFLGFFLGKFIDQVITRLIAAIGVNASVGGAVARWIIIAFSILAAARYLNLQLDLLWPRFIDFLVFAGAIAVGFGFSSRAGEWLEKIKSRF
jgi:hypothetical protein